MKLNLGAVLFGLGVYLPWYLPVLLAAGLAALALSLAICLLFLRLLIDRSWLLPLAFLCFGLSWGIFYTNQSNSRQLIESESGVDARITGVVSSVPQDRGSSQRFELEILSFEPISELIGQEKSPKKILISWYGDNQRLNPGNLLNLEVRLRRPRGLSNFDQFDYRQWLLGRGFDATGYVRKGEVLGYRESIATGILVGRNSANNLLHSYSLRYPEIVSALGLGFQQGLESADWDLFVETGVVHLMVISGLHIGFAGLLGFILGLLISRPLLFCGLIKSDVATVSLASFLMALFYATLAGFSLPTTRALLVLSVFLIARGFRLNWSGWTLLSISFALIALLQPSAVLGDGFWMSFGAVAVLLLSLSGRPKPSYLKSMCLAQIMLLIGFGGLLLALQRPVYLAGVVANLVAVPFAGFLLVPLILLSMVFMPISDSVSGGILSLVDWLIFLLLEYLRWLQGLGIPRLVVDGVGEYFPLLICLAGLIFISFPAISLRIGLSLTLLPLFFGLKKTDADFSILVFDVGQGTAVLVEQPGYRLLYDTGPAFSDNFNAGQDILLPHLQRLAQAAGPSLDALILSHDDSDHSGGFLRLIENTAIEKLYLGGSNFLSSLPNTETALCSSNHKWQVGAVSYAFLHPGAEGREDYNLSESDNNQSCVLFIRFANQKILLSGDIESSVELDLIAQYSDLQDVDWLLGPHHGSKTSSNPDFVQSLHPGVVVFSSGYGNSYGHPAEEVLDRYLVVGSSIHQTGYMGAIRYSWDWNLEDMEAGASMEWISDRSESLFWWQE